MGAHVGVFGPYFIPIAIFFAFTSILGNYSCSEMATVYLGVGHHAALTGLRIIVLVMGVWGAPQGVATVFDAADASMGLMVPINLVTIVALSGRVMKLSHDYSDQRRQDVELRFHAADHPDITGIDPTIWAHD